MRIAKITIQNLLGIRDFSLRPRTLTILKGANATGKTSLLQSVLRFFEGGHDPGMLRLGAKLGTCVVTLDDGSLLKSRTTAKGTTYEVIPAGADQPVSSPRRYLEELGTILSVDPSRFLSAKPKELAEALLEICPLVFTREELQAHIPEDVHTFPDYELNLEALDLHRNTIYELRTKANRDAKDAAATVRQLSQSLPEASDQDWAGQLTQLRQAQADLLLERQGKLDEAAAGEREQLAELQKEFDRLKLEVVSNFQGRREAAHAEYTEPLDRMNVEIGAVEQRMRNKDRAEGLLRSINEFKEKLEFNEAAADRLTAAIEVLDNLKAAKLSSLPIPGLEVRDGQIFYERIPFEHVNLAKRVEIVFGMSALRAGTLPFMVLDNSELLAPDTWEAFKAGALASGFQVVCARVSDDATLTVETIEPEKQEQQESLLLPQESA